MSFCFHDELTWPLDNPEEISIGRALRHVGLWKFGPAWDAVKSYGTEVEQLPHLEASASHSDLRRAWFLLPESLLRPPPTMRTSSGTRICMGPTLYERARGAISDRNQAALRAASLYSNCKLTIRDYAVRGEVRAFAQAYNGRTLELGRHFWKTDRFHRWFHAGRASMLEAIDSPLGDDQPSLWVFFNREEIQRAFPPDSEGESDIERRNGPKNYSVDVVEKWLETYWGRFDGKTLHTFADGKQRLSPRFKADFTPAINDRFPDISTGVIRTAWESRPPKARAGTGRLRD